MAWRREVPKPEATPSPEPPPELLRCYIEDWTDATETFGPWDVGTVSHAQQSVDRRMVAAWRRFRDARAEWLAEQRNAGCEPPSFAGCSPTWRCPPAPTREGA